MKKYLKLVSAALALIGVVMMFFTQVTVEMGHTGKMDIALKALTGGEYARNMSCNGVGSGLAGYILLGVGAVIMLAVALVPYFKEHDMLSAVVTGLAVICVIVGFILLFLIRKNFEAANGMGGTAGTVYVGWAAIAGGSLGALSTLAGGVSIIFDVNGSN